MTRADSVHSTPPLNTSALTPPPQPFYGAQCPSYPNCSGGCGLGCTKEHVPAAPTAGLDWLDIKPDASPVDIFRAIGRLRKEARDEIDRLIRFLDESENHMELEPSLGWPDRMNQSGDEIEDGTIGETTDCEVNGDEEDASYPEGGCRGLEHPMEDDEDDTDAEPSLGSTGHGSGGTIDYGFAAIRAAGKLVLDCEGDEHDGREPDVDQEHDRADDEPSLGWTVDGFIGNTDDRTCDLEHGEAALPPQSRTVIDREPLTVENGYRRVLRGLPPAQREAMRERMSYDSGVSLVGGPEWGMP